MVELCSWSLGNSSGVTLLRFDKREGRIDGMVLISSIIRTRYVYQFYSGSIVFTTLPILPAENY